MKAFQAIVSAGPLDIDVAMQYVQNDAHGAIDLFVGTVRNTHAGKSVTGITYDLHEKLAEKTLQKICEEAQGVWPGTIFYVAHYKGVLAVGGKSIIIAVSSAHRAESFDACRYIIEEIKKRAPVWKKEHYVDGISDWLPGHSLLAKAESLTICCGQCEES